MATITTGKYITQRDGGVKYSYAVSWHRTGPNVYWVARVRRDGPLVGAPSGKIDDFRGTNEDAARLVQERVKSAIQQEAATMSCDRQHIPDRMRSSKRNRDTSENGGWKFNRGKHGWRWRRFDPDTDILISRSTRTYRSWDECLDNAIVNGYTMQRPSKRRAEQGVDVDLSGTLRFGDTSAVCAIRNVSSNGFLFEANTELPRGQLVQLAVRLYPDKLLHCTVQIEQVDKQRFSAMVLDMAASDQDLYRQFIAEQRGLRKRRKCSGDLDGKKRGRGKAGVSGDIQLATLVQKNAGDLPKVEMTSFEDVQEHLQRITSADSVLSRNYEE